MTEGEYKTKLKEKLEEILPGCIILKNDANYKQGIPDLIILHGKKWAMLEAKKSSKSSHQPNQDHYIEVLNKMSYASFVYPENESEVLNAIQKTFRTRRPTRISKSF